MVARALRGGRAELRHRRALDDGREGAPVPDDENLAAVLAAPSPGAAKAAGRLVRGFDEERWAAVRYDLVVRGNLAKFGQRPELRDVLLRTGDMVLVEASPTDRIWGIGLAADDPAAASPSR